MSVQPMTKPDGGMNPLFRSAMTGRCDVCGRGRAYYNHDKCSKARQAAGFVLLDRGHGRKEGRE